ncbi:MAG: putative lipid II flippase FtsW [Acidimicrobiales bacterium]
MSRLMSKVRPSAGIIVCVALLLGVGVVMVLASSPYSSLVTYGSVWSVFEHQVAWILLGVVAFIVAAMMPTRFIRKLRYPMLAIALVLLVAVFAPGMGQSVSGSSRWLAFGPVTIQPSEIMKFAWCVFAADLLARRVGEEWRPRDVMIPLLALLAVSCALIVKQPDLGTTIVIVLITIAMMVASGLPVPVVLKVTLGLFAIGTGLAFAAPYRRARLLSFIHPFAHEYGSGYQVVQSLISLGTGGVSGVGLGRGSAQWGFLPHAHTDFIFSIIGEQAGLVGTVLVVVLIFMLVGMGIRVATAASGRFESLLAVAITCWLAAESLINMGASLGLLPVTGIPLPLVSYGGSSMLVTMAAIGVLLRIAIDSERGLTVIEGGLTRGTSRHPVYGVPAREKSFDRG